MRELHDDRKSGNLHRDVRNIHLGYLINSEPNDDEDITKGRDNFIVQVNNTQRYFRSLDSLEQHKLFQSYGTIAIMVASYGIEQS